MGNRRPAAGYRHASRHVHNDPHSVETNDYRYPRPAAPAFRAIPETLHRSVDRSISRVIDRADSCDFIPPIYYGCTASDQISGSAARLRHGHDGVALMTGQRDRGLVPGRNGEGIVGLRLPLVGTNRPKPRVQQQRLLPIIGIGLDFRREDDGSPPYVTVRRRGTGRNWQHWSARTGALPSHRRPAHAREFVAGGFLQIATPAPAGNSEDI